MVKRKEKTDKQYHGQKKRQTNNTIVKEKKKRQKDKIHIQLYRKLQIRQHQ
jgi:hypothetical protein